MIVDVEELGNELEAYVDRAGNGEPFVITRDGEPIAQLVRSHAQPSAADEDCPDQLNH